MKIYPFHGVRPGRSIAGHLITRPYAEYSQRELEAALDYNPYSFLQILNPGYRFHQNVRGESRFQLVRNRFVEFKENEYLRRDDESCYYVYRKTIDGKQFTGVIANVSVDDYHTDRIKKHENTIQHRVELFKDYLHTVGYNAEPVLMTYEDTDDIDQLMESISSEPAHIEAYTSDQVLHEIWCITGAQQALLSESMESIGHIYIADGHHRSASCVLLADEYGAERDSYGYFMSYLLPESQMQIESFNRLIRGLNGYSPKQLLLELDYHFQIEPLGLHYQDPTGPHEMTMYLSGAFYTLTLRESRYDSSDPLSNLNTQILYDTILRPILGIKDLRSDQRLHYQYGTGQQILMKELIDQGKYDIGFGLSPLDISDIKAVADAGLTMPPKSTYIRPKLYSGLVIYEY